MQTTTKLLLDSRRCGAVPAQRRRQQFSTLQVALRRPPLPLLRCPQRLDVSNEPVFPRPFHSLFPFLPSVAPCSQSLRFIQLLLPSPLADRALDM